MSQANTECTTEVVPYEQCFRVEIGIPNGGGYIVQLLSSRVGARIGDLRYDAYVQDRDELEIRYVGRIVPRFLVEGDTIEGYARAAIREAFGDALDDLGGTAVSTEEAAHERRLL